MAALLGTDVTGALLACALPLGSSAGALSGTAKRNQLDSTDDDDAGASPVRAKLGDGDLGRWRSRLYASVRLQDRLKLLTDLGLTDYEIGRVLPKGGSARSVRRWRRDGVTSQREAALWQPIDDLCAVVGYLLADGTYDERAAIAWLRSRHPDLAQRRPLDVLGTGCFHAVLSAAQRSLGVATITAAQPGPITQAFAERSDHRTNESDVERRVPAHVDN